jgi:hypothetical protein
MLNRTNGAGYSSLPVLPPTASGTQPAPAPSRLPVQGGPQPSARMPAPRAGTVHPLQSQWRGSAPPAEPPASQSVGRHTTILDMVKWDTKQNVEQAANLLVMGHESRAHDPRLGNAGGSAEPRIKLTLDGGALSPAQAQYAEMLGKQAAKNMLHNTTQRYNLQGTPAAQFIQSVCDWLGDPRNRMTAGVLGDITRKVGEMVHAQESKALGPSREPREAKRMPMECMTHLGHAIRHMQHHAGPEHRKFLKELGYQTMDRVMQHKLEPGETRAWLRQVEADCRNQGLDDLGKLAKRLRHDIPASADGYETRLHDNIYGRAMESVLIAELVRDPPANVKQGMAALALHLDLMLKTLPPQAQQDTALQVQKMMRHERRGWQADSPALEAFFNARPDQALGVLKQLLRTPVANGFDCIAIPYLTVKMSLCMQAHGAAPWMPRANQNYANVVGHAAARLTESAPNYNRMAPKSGITMHHQPDIVGSREAAMHPGDRNRPDLEHASPELRTALEHGVSFVSGVSGSTNIVMHMVGDILDQGGKVNPKDALLGTMMFLNFDGGHSMHEAMWVGNQLDSSLDLRMGMPGGDPRSFVADYDSFIESFSPAKGRDQLRAAADKAWDKTLDHFGRHSHYSPENRPPVA